MGVGTQFTNSVNFILVNYHKVGITDCMPLTHEAMERADAGPGVQLTCAEQMDWPPKSYPGILPRKSGHLLSHDQKIFVAGFALGTLVSVVGAWAILKIALSWAN